MKLAGSIRKVCKKCKKDGQHRWANRAWRPLCINCELKTKKLKKRKTQEQQKIELFNRKLKAETIKACKNRFHVFNTDCELIIGARVSKFRDKIESMFHKGMSWEYYGKSSLVVNKWQLDHIIPLSSAKSLEEAKKLWRLSNLQPLWQFDNLSKGAKIPVMEESKVEKS